jgi:hypothetical protein
MKKIFLLLAAAFCLCMANKTMAQVASGATEDCIWKLTGTSGNYTLISKDIPAMGQQVFYDYSGLTGVRTIPCSANAIGNYAFSNRKVFPTINFAQRDAGRLSPLLFLPPATRADFPYS